MNSRISWSPEVIWDWSFGQHTSLVSAQPLLRSAAVSCAWRHNHTVFSCTTDVNCGLQAASVSPPPVMVIACRWLLVHCCCLELGARACTLTSVLLRCWKSEVLRNSAAQCHLMMYNSTCSPLCCHAVGCKADTSALLLCAHVTTHLLGCCVWRE